MLGGGESGFFSLDLVTAFNGSTTYSFIQSDSEFIIIFELTEGKDTVELETEIIIKASVVKTLTISGLPAGSLIEEGQFFISSTSEETILSAGGQMLSKRSGSTWIRTSQGQKKYLYYMHI